MKRISITAGFGKIKTPLNGIDDPKWELEEELRILDEEISNTDPATTKHAELLNEWRMLNHEINEGDG